MIFAWTFDAFCPRELVLVRRGHEDLARQLEDLRLVDFLRTGKALERLLLRIVLQKGRHIEPLGVGDPAANVGHADDLRAGGMAHLRGDRADVAEPLHRDAEARELEAVRARRLAGNHHEAAAGRFHAPARTAHVNGFPVTTAVTVWRMCIEYVSMIHAIVCSFVSHVRRGNVGLRSDQVDDRRPCSGA